MMLSAFLAVGFLSALAVLALSIAVISASALVRAVWMVAVIAWEIRAERRDAVRAVARNRWRAALRRGW